MYASAQLLVNILSTKRNAMFLFVSFGVKNFCFQKLFQVSGFAFQ